MSEPGASSIRPLIHSCWSVWHPDADRLKTFCCSTSGAGLGACCEGGLVCREVRARRFQAGDSRPLQPQPLAARRRRPASRCPPSWDGRPLRAARSPGQPPHSAQQARCGFATGSCPGQLPHSALPASLPLPSQLGRPFPAASARQGSFRTAPCRPGAAWQLARGRSAFQPCKAAETGLGGGARGGRLNKLYPKPEAAPRDSNPRVQRLERLRVMQSLRTASSGRLLSRVREGQRERQRKSSESRQGPATCRSLLQRWALWAPARYGPACRHSPSRLRPLPQRPLQRGCASASSLQVSRRPSQHGLPSRQPPQRSHQGPSLAEQLQASCSSPLRQRSPSVTPLGSHPRLAQSLHSLPALVPPPQPPSLRQPGSPPGSSACAAGQAPLQLLQPLR